MQEFHERRIWSIQLLPGGCQRQVLRNDPHFVAQVFFTFWLEIPGGFTNGDETQDP